MTARAIAAATAAALLAACAGAPAPAPAPTPATIPGTSAPPSPLAALRHDIDSMVALPEFRNAHWGILIVDPERGDTLYSHEAGKLFMPASNMKVITGSVALTQLGPDFRFRTTFVADGEVCDGVLHGDLVVNGRGDPSESDHMRGDAMAPMREMADSLAARGITRITGHVLPGADVFPGTTLGFGWSWDDLPYSYGAGVDELYFDEGFGRVVVQGGARAGRPARVLELPTSRYPVVRNEVRTTLLPDTLHLAAAGDTPPNGDLETAVDSATGQVVLSGWILPGAVDTIEVVYPDQRAAYIAALSQALADRGISIGAPARLASRAHGARRAAGRAGRGGGCGTASGHVAGGAAAPADTIFTYQSPPLSDVIAAMFKPSQNQIAEILLRTIALERTGVGRPDSGVADVKRQLLAWGVQPDGFVLHDGSGLSRYDYLSPETLVRVLDTMRHSPAFAAFYNGLPIAGVDGTLAHRMRGTPAEGNVHAKTGYVANARSLSGYVTTADGRVLVFSALCNNWTVPVRDVEAVQDAIAERLASMRLDGAR